MKWTTERAAYMALLDDIQEIPRVTFDVAGDYAPFAKWTPRWPGRWYDYRTIFSTELVFDIGDCNDRECGAGAHEDCWPSTVESTHELWDRLEGEGYEPFVDYWPALSGGKGTHTHVWVDEPSYREPFARYIARSTLSDTPSDWSAHWNPGDREEIEYDPCTIDPIAGNRMVREFGVPNPNMGFRKTLWDPHTHLPRRRAYAYTTLGSIKYPGSRRSIGQPRGAVNRELRETFGGPCPRSRDCLLFPPCNTCPSVRF